MEALRFVEVLDDEGAAGVVAVGADAVEGEDEGVAELVDVAAEPEGGGVGEVGAGDELGGDGVRAEAAERAGDGAVGTDQDAGVVEAERAQDVHGVGVAAAGGDDDLDAGGLGGVEGGEVARADAAVVAEQSAVHVDGDHADGGLQGFLVVVMTSLNGLWNRSGFVPASALCSGWRVKISLGERWGGRPAPKVRTKP